MQKAQNSFRVAGIFLYDPEQFSGADFASSLVTDVPLDAPIDHNNEEAKKGTSIALTPPPDCSKNISIQDENYPPVNVTPPPCSSKATSFSIQ